MPTETQVLRAIVVAVLFINTPMKTGRATAWAGELRPITHGVPKLTVDLGVGLWAWPLPMDFDGDGDLDLVVSCPNKPSNGTYFFENTSGNVKQPVFKAGRKIAPGFRNIRVSHINGKPRVLVPGREYRDFTNERFDKPTVLGLAANIHEPGRKIRANQWSYVDIENDGDLDVIVGVGDWADYGWDDAYDTRGRWTNGPLRGYVYLIQNDGTNAKPKYAKPRKLAAGKKPLEVFGWPSPNFADFDGDGDLDVICGEFLDRFTWFENSGTREKPRYRAGRFLTHKGKPLRMNLQMIVPTAIDWDKDGDVDLVVGDEDGRVALVEHSGRVVNGQPKFLPPRYFQQQADGLKFGALATPFAVDWDGDGDQDLLCGNTAGSIGYFENLGGNPTPRWAAPKLLQAGGKVIRIQAGANGSIQGPCEAKWGYTTLTAGDWDHDGRVDLVVNSIWGAIEWYRNVGIKTQPRLAAAQHIEVDWPGKPPKPDWVWWQQKGKQLVTQWRTTPMIVDFNTDGLNDLVMLDHEGYLALFPRRRAADNSLHLRPGKRIFVDEAGKPLRLNPGRAGKSGRRKLHVVDWDGDGRLDLLVNSVNADFYRNLGEKNGLVMLRNEGPLAKTKLAGHTSSPTTVDWNRDGIPDLLVGAEDGRLYHMPNPRTR